MKRSFALLVACACGLSACAPSHSELREIADVPLKSTSVPDWESGLLRANATYHLYGAMTSKERVALLGDYYYVTWYDASPEQKTRLVFQYQQSATGSQVKEVVKTFAPGREPGERHECFRFTGKEREKLGDILAWRLLLDVDGKVVDSEQSYLWE